MDKSELKKDFLEFVGYRKKMAIIHDEHCHVVEHKKIGYSGMKNNGKSSDAGSRNYGTTLEETHIEVPATRRLTVTERSPDMEGSRNRRALENSRHESSRHASTRRSLRARSTSCLTVHTLERTKLWPCCPSTRKRGTPTRRRRTLRLWATTERRMTTEMARPRISQRRISESRSRYWHKQAQTTSLYRAVLWRTQGSVTPSQGRGIAGAHHAEHGYQG
jgi:hypothetical protein